jgi:hypothetical protein
LIRKGDLIRDLRDEKSQAYRVTSQLQMNNPVHNGLYELLLAPDKFERCLGASCRQLASAASVTWVTTTCPTSRPTKSRRSAWGNNRTMSMPKCCYPLGLAG